MGAIFGVPLADFDEPAGTRIALVPRGGTPLPELDARRRRRLRARRRAGRAARDVLARCDARASIPHSGGVESLNVAMAGTIALYELAAGDGLQLLNGDGTATERHALPSACPHCSTPRKRSAPLPGPIKKFSESVALSSTSSNRPSASGLPPLRRTAWPRFRPSRAPCSLQGGRYGCSTRDARARAQKISRNLRSIICGERSRPCLRRRRTAAGRTSRSTPSTSKPASPSSACHRRRLEPPRASSSTRRARREPTASASARRESQSARSKIPGSRSIQRPCVSSMSSARGREDVEHEPAAGLEQLARRGERLEPLLVRRQVEVGAERARDERDALVHRRLAEVAEPQVEQRRRRPPRRPLARRPRASRPTSRRRSRGPPPSRSGSRSGPCRRRARPPDRPRERLLDVERDVLDHARAPRVVEPRDRVVGGHAASRGSARIQSPPWTGRPGSYEREALAAVDAGATPAEVEDACASPYLGRKCAR